MTGTAQDITNLLGIEQKNPKQALYSFFILSDGKVASAKREEEMTHHSNQSEGAELWQIFPGELITPQAHPHSLSISQGWRGVGLGGGQVNLAPWLTSYLSAELTHLLRNLAYSKGSRATQLHFVVYSDTPK